MQAGIAFQPQFHRLAGQLRPVAIQLLLRHFRDIALAHRTFIAREQQQGADQVGALLLGALDASQPGACALVQLGARQQQFHRPPDHRQWRAQLMTDIGIELTVALHHLGQARSVIIQRLGQLAHFVIWKAGRQRFRLGAVAGAAQALRQIGHRGHHL